MDITPAGISNRVFMILFLQASVNTLKSIDGVLLRRIFKLGSVEYSSFWILAAIFCISLAAVVISLSLSDRTVSQVLGIEFLLEPPSILNISKSTEIAFNNLPIIWLALPLFLSISIPE